jgi:uncharacterized protein YpmB
MALTFIIILTFVIPAIVIAIIVAVYRHYKREVHQERAENEKLIKAYEDLDATKDSVIEKLERLLP